MHECWSDPAKLAILGSSYDLLQAGSDAATERGRPRVWTLIRTSFNYMERGWPRVSTSAMFKLALGREAGCYRPAD